jgi:peptidoglycan-associated lipoprotein
MKQIAYSVLLLALLAGCSGTPSKEAAIEERGTKAAEAAPVEGAKIVEATRVETKAVKSTVPVSRAASTADEGVKTSGAAPKAVSAKTIESVQTHAVAAPSSEVKPLADGKPSATADAKSGGPAAQDGSGLPQPDAAPSWGDLKNPESPLSKRRLLFDYDSATIRDEYRPVLEAHAKFMTANKDAKVILQGHADERGSREYNLALGQRRAESVFKAMTLLGVPEAQMEAVSLGEEKPIAEGHDEAAWQQNRRTEILYQGE